MRDLLEKTSRAELIDFLVDYAECDAHFKNKDEQEKHRHIYKTAVFHLENEVNIHLFARNTSFLCCLWVCRYEHSYHTHDTVMPKCVIAQKCQ